MQAEDLEQEFTEEKKQRLFIGPDILVEGSPLHQDFRDTGDPGFVHKSKGMLKK